MRLKIAENHLSGNYEEKIESYDKEEQLMIYLSKGHSPNDKYESYDEILMPIGALLNNTLNYQEKNEVIKEYGLDDEEFKERMRDMCNLGEALELEASGKTGACPAWRSARPASVGWNAMPKSTASTTPSARTPPRCRPGIWSFSKPRTQKPSIRRSRSIRHLC